MKHLSEDQIAFYRKVYASESKKLAAVSRKIADGRLMEGHARAGGIALSAERIAARMDILLRSLLKE